MIIQTLTKINLYLILINNKSMTTKDMALGLILALFFVFLLGKLPTTNASNYYPPRIQQLCYDNWYGTDWNKSMKYEKRCRVLWTAWTEGEKSHSPY